ncbi:PREDICTED: dystrotelin [Dipodomys ordii]|uniref:Dystrotelin n=1 Tax=Dipodomys ordii TaxID=10020 RepID=A0A1S3F765_DIPOR|nr:PREDICTED: dystrotelin [Dipodomys ordii]
MGQMVRLLQGRHSTRSCSWKPAQRLEQRVLELSSFIIFCACNDGCDVAWQTWAPLIGYGKLDISTTGVSWCIVKVTESRLTEGTWTRIHDLFLSPSSFSLMCALNSIENSVYRTAFKLRSVQTLCQLDLMDSSLIQQVLLRPRFPEARESSLSIQQVFQELQELFQKVKDGKPGLVHPRAPELTLSLLMAMYDSTGSGFLKLLPAAAALIALSGDNPLTKYRALFQLYAQNNKRGYDSGARMTRRTLRNLLMDIQQIPTAVGERHTPCSVESAIHSCFRGVLSPGIKEEKFLSWVQSEPLILLWLPTCHRLSATEQTTHAARCRVCGAFPITGLRYCCRKCLHFDICHVCFLSGLHSKSHQKSHLVIEHHVQISTKENTKLLLKNLRNNLLQGNWWRKETTGRQWLLDQVTSKDMANRAQARILKKQLKRYKDKLRAIYTLQEERRCRFETKIHELKANQDSLRTTLQQMEQELQAVLPLLHPSSSCQNIMCEAKSSSSNRTWKGGESSQIKNASEGSPKWEPIPNSAVIDRRQRSQANAEFAQENTEPPANTLQSTTAQSQSQKMPKEIPSFLSSHQKERLKISPAEMGGSLALAERKEIVSIQERDNEQEGEELQDLLSKLLDAFNPETTSGPQSSVNTDLYSGAERLCRAFSAFVDLITLPNLK